MASLSKAVPISRGPAPKPGLLRAGAVRAAAFALLWWILTGHSLASWTVGLPVVACATLASVALLAPGSWSVMGLLRFVPFFLWHSLRGGVDVARRALHPGVPIDPLFFDYALRLPPGRARVSLVMVINLLPGTLSASVSADTLRIHALTRSAGTAAEIASIERRIASIFGIPLSVAGGLPADAAF
jgi:multicomponent Na+:H+ antiporter subunit E